MRDTDFERSIYAHAAEAAPAGSLFETFADKALRQVEDVIASRYLQRECSPQERAFLNLLRLHQGKANALLLDRFAEQLNATPRTVKGWVQGLREVFGVQIGASRDGDAGGYYLCATYEESVESTEQMLHQAVAMLRVVARMRGGRHSLDQLLTQLRLELEEQAPR